MKLDYEVLEINNVSGELSSHYPSQILIPESEKPKDLCQGNLQKKAQILSETGDPTKLRELINKARFAR